MDSLEQCRVFLDCFKANVNPSDPLPVRVPVYNLKYDEIKPAIVDWTRTYLDQFGCPQCIMTPIIRKACEEVLIQCNENPTSCGFNLRDYKTLQLNYTVISHVNQICSNLLDNENLNKLLAEQYAERSETDHPGPGALVAMRKKMHFSRGVKHRRRTMEDRHVCLPDFSVLFDTKDVEPTAFYGVYDGHGGQEAASFATSHLHYYIAQSEHYPHDMEAAIREGFLKTDKLFLQKCADHHLRSGCTAVVCFYRLHSGDLHLAWVGDSLAYAIGVSKVGARAFNIVHHPHVASDWVEANRVRNQGGSVILWQGQHRVEGQLAITRAIGNPCFKSVVPALPEYAFRRTVGQHCEDVVLVLASDGLWESLDPFYVSMIILYGIRKFPDNLQKITDLLIDYAKPKTQDNISVIILFLKDPQTIIKQTPWIEELEAKAGILEKRKMDINGAENNGFLAEKDPIYLEDQKAFADIQNFMSMDSALLQSKNDCDSPCDEPVPERFLPEGEFGPETDVDGIPVAFELPSKDIIAEVVNPEKMRLDLDFLNGLKNANNEVEEEASSVSADPVDLSEEQAEPESPNVNGTAGEQLHFDAPTETGDLIGSVEQEDEVPTLKAELNENELAPLKSIDEPIVSDLLDADSIVDNKLIDQLDSFGISDAIRRQLIEQTVPGSALNHEQDEDDDDGQLMEEKHSEFEGDGDGVEKEDLHHEKAFDSDIANDQHVKQDDDAGCCEESEEDEWDYVKVNKQQQQQQQQEQHQLEQPQSEEKPQESTSREETVEHGNSNAFIAEEDLPVERQIEQDETHEIEQHHYGDPADEQEEQEQQEEKPVVEELYQEQEREGEQFDATAVEPNTSETPVDILGDNTESTVSDSTKEVDDVIIDGGEAKEVVNLLNDDLNEDVPQPTAIEPLCDTSVITEEDSSAAPPVPSDSVNMEASMYGGSVAEQPVSPDTPVSPVEAFQAQQQQDFSADKDMFGSRLDDTLSPTGTEELREKHLYEAEEKTMFQADAAGGDLMQQGAAGDLGWQLNPEAKEFVPVVSPTSEEPPNVFAPTRMLEHESFKLREDAIVAQSPRKGTAPSMEDLDLPAEREFQTEMDKRPHEFETTVGGGGGDQPSPLSPNPFNQLDDQTMLPGNGFDLINGGEVLQPEEVDLLSTVKSDPDPFGVSDNAPSEELELLNKVQDLPLGDDEEQQEALITPQQAEPVQAALFGQEEQSPDLMEPEAYSAKEEQYVEQKETVDEYEFLEKPSDLADPYNGELENMDKAAGDSVAAHAYPAQTAAFDMFGLSQPTPTTEETVPMETDEEPKQVQQETLLEASVYDPEPLVLTTQEASQVPSDPEPSPEVVSETVPASVASELVAEPHKEQQTIEPEQPVPEEQPKESEKLTEDNKAVVESAAAGVAVATAAVAAAAVAATATAVSKTAAKPKASSAAVTAKKAGPTTATATKSSKDVAAKSAPAASRVGGGAAAPAASRKPTVPAAKKVPSTTTTTAKPPTGATTNGVKEARPASTTTKAPLAAKKPATEAAKTATTKTTTAASSVAAARTKAAATGPSSTTKPASASSTTRTAAPKPAATGTTTAAKPSSRASTTGTTTRTVTSRPSSAISTSSVPSKPASATTTTAAKRTVATKITNGTTTTDGVTKTTKMSSTTTSSTASRTGVTRTTGTGTAASKPASTLAAKKPLDTKPAAATKTATSGNKPSTTTRTSLAPKTTATSPAVRKVQQNGVAKKPTATSPNPGAKKVAVSAKKPEEELAKTNTSTTPTPTTTIETNGSAHENEQAMVEPPSPQPAADQLLVPIPQAM
ncbi:titin-like [Anopheles ziemanni]|uniref:titin-like n=1 Tax=Anopheles coustani TaxID=139045 RepID=UPI002658AFA9|nr:titin-like [Anopheles coustani]XP_058169507.1 titin-like [Anopheles ziemanni]